jgi:hypothetical protein
VTTAKHKHDAKTDRVRGIKSHESATLRHNPPSEMAPGTRTSIGTRQVQTSHPLNLLRRAIGISWSELSAITGLNEQQLKDSARVRGQRKRNPLHHNSQAKWNIVNQLGVGIDGLVDRAGSVVTITGASYSLLWFFAWKPADLNASRATALKGTSPFTHLMAMQILAALHRQEWFMQKYIYPQFEDADDVPWRSVIRRFALGRNSLFHFRAEIRRKMFNGCATMRPPTHTEIYHAVRRFSLHALIDNLDRGRRRRGQV